MPMLGETHIRLALFWKKEAPNHTITSYNSNVTEPYQ